MSARAQTTVYGRKTRALPRSFFSLFWSFLGVHSRPVCTFMQQEGVTTLTSPPSPKHTHTRTYGARGADTGPYPRGRRVLLAVPPGLRLHVNASQRKKACLVGERLTSEAMGEGMMRRRAHERHDGVMCACGGGCPWWLLERGEGMKESVGQRGYTGRVCVCVCEEAAERTQGYAVFSPQSFLFICNHVEMGAKATGREMWRGEAPRNRMQGRRVNGSGGGVDPLWTGTATPHPTLLTQTSPSGARTSVCLSYSSYCSPLFPGVCCTATPVAYLPPLPPDSATLCFLIIFFFLKMAAQCVASSSSAAASTVDDALPRRPALPSLHS